MPSPTVPSELHLRHLPVDEALYRLDAYLDAAFMAGYPRVRIIHGKGTGAVKNAAWQRLAQHPLVRNYALAPYGQGDAGVTVVEMEQRMVGAQGLAPLPYVENKTRDALACIIPP